MADEQDIVVREDGSIAFVYSDLLADVFAGEEQRTVRASHVEPHPLRGGWLADMRPSGGPVLGEGCSLHLPAGEIEWTEELTHPGTVMPGFRTRALDDAPALIGALVPFATRQAALDAEREWLRRERGL